MSIERGARADQHPCEFASFGPFRLIRSARRLEREGVLVELGGRALDILLMLVEHAGKVVTRAEMMSSIWRDTTVVDGVLRVHVCNLRKSLSDGVDGARYITSVAGRGYCFVAPVVRSSTATSDSSSNDPVLDASIDWKCPHGLPPRLARMAGRDEVVRTVCGLLAEHRFVNIVGAAGIGKTTVAVAAAHTLLEDFAGAACFIELGSITDEALVPATVASTLGVPVHQDDVLPSLHAFLRDKRVLIVLDNCEHVIDAAARLAEYLFIHAPRVHLLLTSREALRVEGERIHRLGPLETPTEYAAMSAAVVQTFPAVQVLLERAAANGWCGDLTDDDVPAVAETCKRLDGVALAIELVASCVAECGLQGAAAMLDDRLRLLWRRGRRTAPARQQTLHALIAWSTDRLPESERVALRRLSVFMGTFPLEAAQAVVLEADVCDDSFAVVINELVGKSLLSSTVEDGSIVYRMLETTRVYALGCLAESGEFEQVSFRHAAFFAERLGALPKKKGRRPARSLDGLVYARFTEEFGTPDLRAARELLEEHVTGSGRWLLQNSRRVCQAR